MDPGVATTRPEYTEVFNGGGSEGEGPGGSAAMLRWSAFYASVMVIVAALEARECEKI